MQAAICSRLLWDGGVMPGVCTKAKDYGRQHANRPHGCARDYQKRQNARPVLDIALRLAAGVSLRTFLAVRDTEAPRQRVKFAVTGSSMAQAWLGFSYAAPYGHTLEEARHTLTIPINTSPAVARVTKMQLCRWYPDVKLPDQLFKTYQDPAWLCYLADFYQKTGSVDEARSLAVRSSTSDFSAEVRRLASALANHPELVLELQAMIGKGSRIDPRTWGERWGKAASTLYTSHFINFITESREGVWKLAPCIYGELLANNIKPDGTFREDPRSNSDGLVNDVAEPFLHVLSALAGQLDPDSKSWQPQRAESTEESAASEALNCLLSIVDEEADKVGWLLTPTDALDDPYFKYVLDHNGNHILLNESQTAAEYTLTKLSQGREDKQWVRRQYLKLLFNVWIHTNRDRQDQRHYANVFELRDNLPRLLRRVALRFKHATFFI
ncbi:hypothetical protein JKP88DRAFT_248961 [Tribonema minus]|uniref:Uncharacterized protein n=1 Tax=Tribonema minus TaxID=303371 RepID=A0A836C8N6_9STRA|nr:hypothetical protein JKP88DRAFT_248961 [Tribonema minus]